MISDDVSFPAKGKVFKMFNSKHISASESDLFE